MMSIRTPRFYCAQIDDAQFVLPDTVIQHLRVLRLAAGADIVLFNGVGAARRAKITLLDRRRAEVVLGEYLPPEVVATPKLILAQALLSAEKMDWVMQKATELGAAGITPIVSERAWKLDRERIDKRMAHWQAVLIAACEQCGRNHVPELTPPQPLRDLVAAEGGWWLTLGTAPRLRSVSAPSQATFLVGPEGGWTAAEESWLAGQGWQPLSLGPRVLRTETAGLAALAAAQALWGDG